MRHTLLLESPKREEEQVIKNLRPSKLPEFHIDVDEFKGILGFEDVDSFLENNGFYGQMNWDFMDLEGLGVVEEVDNGQRVAQMGLYLQESNCVGNLKREDFGLWDGYCEEYKKVSLNLSLNYQEVLDAWSDKGSLFTDEYASSMANSSYMGEVPIMEEDRTRSREASVMRYKEKRQSRLFSKKIRYQVRKLNADNRPRLKGRFVKRMLERTPKG